MGNNGLYEVIQVATLRDIKRSIDVRLSKKVDSDTLRAIALELKAKELCCFDRTFIVYYLPGMTVDAGGWATTHFTPDLEVRILGSTGEEESTCL